MKFILNIKLGGEAMQSGDDLGGALVLLALKNFMGYGAEISGRDGGKVMDSNGAALGHGSLLNKISPARPASQSLTHHEVPAPH